MQDPTYLGWNDTIRSDDGHVVQHLEAKDIGFQAGNWYVNQHSIGIEHEGFAAQGARWYTESLYENSATPAKYLANKYSVSLTQHTSSGTTRCRASPRRLSRACTGTRARTGTGSTTSSSSAC